MAVEELYRAERLPVFQNTMFRTRDEALRCVKGDVVLVRDRESGLVFNQAFQPELLQYGADYQNEQGLSAAFQAHLDDVSAIVRRHFQGRTLIEVGCGKGYFLERLLAQGFRITGLDAAYEGDSPHVVKALFTPEVGLRADGIVLRHVLEHVRDPVGFLRQVRDANGGAGTIYIEVPCLDWICAHRAWFDVFYEHVNYFRLSDFSRMFGEVREAGRIFGGQYLYVVADLATVRSPRADAADDLTFPTDFVATVDRYASMIRARAAAGREAHTVVWGGASKGVIFSLFMQRAGASVDFVVDINPAKQGRYLAATGLEVSAPDAAMARVAPGSTVFVMNGNYLPEIRQMTRNEFCYQTVDHEDV